MNFGQSLGFFCLLISLYVLWQIRQLLLLLFTAIIFAVVLNRLVDRLIKFKLRRSLAIGLMIITIFVLVNLLFLLILPPFIGQFKLLVDLLPVVWSKILLILEQFDLAGAPWLSQLPKVNQWIDNYQLVNPKFLNNFFQVFSDFFSVSLQLILVMFLTVVFLFNPQRYRGYLLQLFPSFYRRRANEILDKTEKAIASWLSGIFINCLFIGILSGAGLFLLQVKLVLVHALLAGLLNFIPNIGPAASVIFPITIAVLDAPWKILPIVIWYFIIQNIESYWLTPKVMAEKVSLLPAITLFAQIFFARAFGLLGLLLALPLTVVVKTWVDEVLFEDILDKWGKST